MRNFDISLDQIYVQVRDEIRRLRSTTQGNLILLQVFFCDFWLLILTFSGFWSTRNARRPTEVPSTTSPTVNSVHLLWRLTAVALQSLIRLICISQKRLVFWSFWIMINFFVGLRHTLTYFQFQVFNFGNVDNIMWKDTTFTIHARSQQRYILACFNSLILLF
jgi:hypothetical protein